MSESSGVRVFILSVTRDLSDALGAELAEAVEAAGHRVLGRDLVLPDGDAARAAVGRRLSDPQVQALIVAGGARRWGGDAGSRAVASRIARPLTGFAELYRALVLGSRGGDALLDDVQAGLVEGRRAIFALPDDLGSALEAARTLVLPILGELIARADGAFAVEATSIAPRAPAEAEALPAVDDETPAAQLVEATGGDEGPAPVTTQGVSVTPILSAKPADDKPALASGWEAGMRALGGELRRSWPTIPESFERMAAALEVLNSANQRGEVLTGDGRRYGAFAWPDFTRTDARILLVRELDEGFEVLALHRHPRPVGTCAEGGSLKLPATDPVGLSEAMFQKPPPDGDLFAVEGDAIYLQSGRHVTRWDGRREQDQGTPSQALASLLLRWSQR